MDRFLEMRTFVQVVDTGSFVGAAEPLDMSKAAVSRYVADLEARLGVRLLHRTTRRLSLTEDGEVFYLRCKELLGGLDAAEAEVTARSGDAVGQLRVNAPVSFGILYLAPVWAAFKARHPQVSFDVTLSDRVVDIVEEGFDLAIRHTNTPPETHVAWVLCETRSLLVASPQYLARRGQPLHPSDLASHDCLLYLRDSHAGRWTFARPASVSGKRKPAADAVERVGVHVAGSLKANNSEVLRDALLAGLGIGLLPDFSLPPAPEGSAPPLVQVLPDWQVQGFFGERIYALRPWSAQVPKAVECLVAHLRQSFAQGFAGIRSRRLTGHGGVKNGTDNLAHE